MTSRSATVLVIFIIAVIAFCLANVFGAMTGPISILPNESDSSGGVLDNLSAITDGTGDSGVRYGNDNYNDYSSSDSSNVETTQDNSAQSSDSGSSSNQPQENPSSSSSSGGSSSSTGSSNPNVETTTDSSSQNVETTTSK